MIPTGEQIVHWTIRAALVCYVAVLAGNLVASHQVRWRRAARWIWVLGCFLFLAHVAAAFHFYHSWSHAHAVAETARQTKALIGWAFGEGLYFSYVFAAAWTLDALWWLRQGEAYYQRSPRVTFALHAYLLFIGINGAMVFESGVTRTGGYIACGLILILLIFRRVRNRRSSQIATMA